jgi:hypothetical protein
VLKILITAAHDLISIPRARGRENVIEIPNEDEHGFDARRANYKDESGKSESELRFQLS